MRTAGGERTRFDIDDARRAVRAAQAAYLEDPARIRERLAAGTVRMFEHGAVAGFAASVGGRILLAFRGTMVPSPEKWHRPLTQWYANLDFAPSDRNGARIHRGISQALDAAWRQVEDALADVDGPAAPLDIAGHSLGGALACLAADRLGESRRAADVFTFGAPAVGDDAFARSFRSSLLRFENADDLVCHLPPPPELLKPLGPVLESSGLSGAARLLPADVRYRPVGQLVFLGWGGTVQVGLSAAAEAALESERRYRLAMAVAGGVPGLLARHKIETYVQRLERGSVVDLSRIPTP